MDFESESASVAVVVRHTFFDLDVDAEQIDTPKRERCFSDSVVVYEPEALPSCDKPRWAFDDDETTATGSTCDGSLTSDHSDVEVEDLTSHQPEGSVCWVPVTPVWKSAGCRSANLPPAQAGPTCQHVGASSKRSTGRAAQNKDKSNGRTTIMLKNLPPHFTRQTLVNLLHSQGLEGLYNFTYLPMDFARGTNLGYATVNMETSYVAELAMQLLKGFNDWNSEKTLEVSWNAPHQGLEELIAFYRNSRSMHPKVPDEYKPFLVQKGVRVALPRPTRRIQEPFVLCP